MKLRALVVASVALMGLAFASSSAIAMTPAPEVDVEACMACADTPDALIEFATDELRSVVQVRLPAMPARVVDNPWRAVPSGRALPVGHWTAKAGGGWAIWPDT
jgi:hypothetical protein